MTETNQKYNAVRQAAALVAQRDDKAESDRIKAARRKR